MTDPPRGRLGKEPVEREETASFGKRSLLEGYLGIKNRQLSLI